MSRSSSARRVARLVACSLLASSLSWSNQASAYPSGGALPAPLTLVVFPGPGVGVPVGAAGVIVNVTIVSPLEDGWARVYPCGAPPSTSTLNFVADQTVPNLAVTGLAADGSFCIDTSSTADVIVDLAGYLPASSTLIPLASPVRFLDTRSGVGIAGPIDAGSITEVQVGGRFGIPTSVDLLVFNATALGAANAGFLTVFPCGEPTPATSSVNFGVNKTVPNLVASRVSADGTVCVVSTATQHVIGDAVAFTIGGTQGITTLPSPQRVLDTRDGTGGAVGPVDSVVRPIALRGVRGIAPSADAVILNVTAANATADGFLTLFPCGGTPPTVSNVNYVARSAVANSAVVKLSDDGEVCVTASARTDVIIDVSGFTTGDSAIVSLPPSRIYDSRQGLEPLCNIGVTNKPDSNDLIIFDLATGAVRHTVALPFHPSSAGITLDCTAILASGVSPAGPSDGLRVSTVSIDGEIRSTGPGDLGTASGPLIAFVVRSVVVNGVFSPHVVTVPGGFPVFPLGLTYPNANWELAGVTTDGSLFAVSRWDAKAGRNVVHYFDRSGRELGKWIAPQIAYSFRLSPDGRYIAYDRPTDGSFSNGINVMREIHVVSTSGVEVAVSDPARVIVRGWLGNGQVYACGPKAIRWKLFAPVEPLIPSNPNFACPLDAK
jgi:hypothetical protein